MGSRQLSGELAGMYRSYFMKEEPHVQTLDAM